ncbi:MAG: hypothetical protein ACJAXH_002976, partial [Colwellia sp.]
MILIEIYCFLWGWFKLIAASGDSYLNIHFCHIADLNQSSKLACFMFT